MKDNIDTGLIISKNLQVILNELFEENISKQSNISLLLALSGGKDSVGLLSLLSKICKEDNNLVLNALYINHGVQNSQDQEHEQYVVQNNCEKFQVPLHEVSLSLPDDLIESGHINEISLRELRYQAFITTAIELQSDCIITAHHQEDTCETILMRILEGRGVRGLQGIPYYKQLHTNPMVFAIRPCLVPPHVISANDLWNEVNNNDLLFHEDASNNDISYVRNQVRTQIVPIIKQFFPQYSKKITDLGISQKQLLHDVLTDSSVIWNRTILPLKNIRQNTRKNTGKNTDPNNNCLRISRNIFEQASYNKRIELLFHGLNIFGVYNISEKVFAPFMSPILPPTTMINISDVIIMLTSNAIVMQKKSTVPNTNEYTELPLLINANASTEYCIRTKVEAELNDTTYQLYINKELSLNIKTQPIQYTIECWGTVSIEYPTKHDTLCINNEKINIRSKLCQHQATLWRTIPIIKDDHGVVAVLGEIAGGISLMRGPIEQEIAQEKQCIQLEVYLLYGIIHINKISHH